MWDDSNDVPSQHSASACRGLSLLQHWPLPDAGRGRKGSGPRRPQKAPDKGLRANGQGAVPGVGDSSPDCAMALLPIRRSPPHTHAQSQETKVSHCFFKRLRDDLSRE